MTTTKRRYRPGTHNGPSQCIHGKSMKTDDCRACWEFRGWKDKPGDLDGV